MRTTVNRDLVKIAAVQVSGYDKCELPRKGYDPIKRITEYIGRAGQDAAQLVIFPEYILGHIRIPGPDTARIAAAAAANGIYVIVGCWEDFPDGRYSNAALIFNRDGNILGKYYKVHAAVDYFEGDPPYARPPAGKDREWLLRHDPEWLMKRGDRWPVFSLDFGAISVMTCYDGWFPETARLLSLKGAELIVWVNGRAMCVEEFIVNAVMHQNEVAMVSVNQAYGGGTMIGDLSRWGGPDRWPAPMLACAPEKEEAYISAEIDLRHIRELRASSRNLRQRRPELYGDLAI